MQLGLLPVRPYGAAVGGPRPVGGRWRWPSPGCSGRCSPRRPRASGCSTPPSRGPACSVPAWSRRWSSALVVGAPDRGAISALTGGSALGDRRLVGGDRAGRDVGRLLRRRPAGRRAAPADASAATYLFASWAWRRWSRWSGSPPAGSASASATTSTPRSAYAVIAVRRLVLLAVSLVLARPPAGPDPAYPAAQRRRPGQRHLRCLLRPRLRPGARHRGRASRAVAVGSRRPRRGTRAGAAGAGLAGVAAAAAGSRSRCSCWPSPSSSRTPATPWG